MFETFGMELIAVLALVGLIVLGGALYFFASFKKQRRMRELERSGEFTADYDIPSD